jgi:hypothetical protein
MRLCRSLCVRRWLCVAEKANAGCRFCVHDFRIYAGLRRKISVYKRRFKQNSRRLLVSFIWARFLGLIFRQFLPLKEDFGSQKKVKAGTLLVSFIWARFLDRALRHFMPLKEDFGLHKKVKAETLDVCLLSGRDSCLSTFCHSSPRIPILPCPSSTR